jgi:uncharacterized membrane protein YeaQ/YmgE (transglycosylase-associated protein family)
VGGRLNIGALGNIILGGTGAGVGGYTFYRPSLIHTRCACAAVCR